MFLALMLIAMSVVHMASAALFRALVFGNFLIWLGLYALNFRGEDFGNSLGYIVGLAALLACYSHTCAIAPSLSGQTQEPSDNP